MTTRLHGPEVGVLRAACFTRDKNLCVECGSRVYPNAAPEAPRRAHMAHVIGRGAGGSDTLDNVRTLCGVCHLLEEHNPKSVKGK